MTPLEDKQPQLELGATDSAPPAGEAEPARKRGRKPKRDTTASAAADPTEGTEGAAPTAAARPTRARKAKSADAETTEASEPKAPKKSTQQSASKSAAKKSAALPSQADPRAPLDPDAFLSAARPVLRLLESDLLERSRKSEGVQRALTAHHEAEVAAHRTADAFPEWERQFVAQIAAAWVLSVVFVRVLEDRGLCARARVAGPGAADSEASFYALAPSLTPRDYLRTVFTELAHFAAGRDLFDARHNPVWLLGPSAEASRALLELFRAPAADAPAFRFGQADTRFLGDLYQDLSEEVRERFALLQTPAFVERYILDRTLEPAIARFGLEATTLIDPTCGSGHFLLGAFDRLLDHWEREHPGQDRRTAIAAALDRVFGVDLNPYAIAIARFRLTLAVIEKGGYRHLHEVPRLPLHLAVADSLLHDATQRSLGDLLGQKAEDWGGRLFRLEDPEASKDVLGRKHTVVVGNPPYITVKDRELREQYRAAYPDSAAGKYSLAAPFAERFFQLARHAGYVGMITANSFMKREFGKGLITKCLPRWNLSGIVNTAGAYIPGHGTPTVILFGTNEPPQESTVWAVLGKRGEPATPDDPEQGLVWRSIADHGDLEAPPSGSLDAPLFENDYISVARIPRTTLQKHPWSLGGGGAAELKELLEERAEKKLGDVVESIGVGGMSNADDVFLGSSDSWFRLGADPRFLRPLVLGEEVRDWAHSTTTVVYFPYDASLDLTPPSGRTLAALWPYRTPLWARVVFGGDTYRQSGRTWYEWHQLTREKYRTPLSITLAFVATHNHFVLDRGGKVFSRSAPVIKLPETATEDDHYALLAYLNSSTACFWMKQVFYPKASGIGDVSLEKGKPEDNRYEFAGTGLLALPIPRFTDEVRTRLVTLARQATEAAAELDSLRGASDLTAAEQRHTAVSAALRAAQEEIDWLVYAAFGLASDALPPVPPAIDARPFELTNEPRDPWLAARIDETKKNPNLALIEGPVFKRLWRGRQGVFGHGTETLAERIRRTQREAALDQLESALRHATSPQSVSTLATTLEPTEVASESVPFLAAHRHTENGLEKRAAWERTWDLQRREDAGENVGDIPVPPKYDPKDFRDPAYYRLRGKLDVPKERFISYPGCESDDDKSPLYGWAGWTHLQQAQALSALYMQRKSEAWTKDRLTPLLAGLLELLPWLKQWHNDPDPAFNDLRLGDYFEGFLDQELTAQELTRTHLQSWRPSTSRPRKHVS